jgi:hypothetical protein
MKPRMMCTDCYRTAEADTVLEGSDLAEIVAWCFFAIPGLLYCWWRHALRIKVCPFCGSGDLVREARAAAAREPRQAPLATGPRVCSLDGSERWPRALAAPRDRLRHGGIAASLVGAFALTTALALLDLAPRDAAIATAYATAVACGLWIVYQLVRVSQMRASVPGCKAWDRYGRPLRIERVS